MTAEELERVREQDRKAQRRRREAQSLAVDTSAQRQIRAQDRAQHSRNRATLDA